MDVFSSETGMSHTSSLETVVVKMWVTEGSRRGTFNTGALGVPVAALKRQIDIPSVLSSSILGDKLKG